MVLESRKANFAELRGRKDETPENYRDLHFMPYLSKIVTGLYAK